MTTKEREESYIEKQKATKAYFDNYVYYFIIGLTSFLALTFLPMVGSTVGLDWNIPDNVVGWIVFIAVKIIVAAINVLIFHSFVQQAKLNVKNEPSYKEANDILAKNKAKEYRPRSPGKFLTSAYAKKGTTIFVTSGLTTIAFTQAILTFDYITMLTYLFTIVMGLVFGVMQMYKTMDYWTGEYLDYAKEQAALKEPENPKEEQQC